MIEKEKTCLLINIVTPDNSNSNTKETEKLSKYKDLEIEISRMCKVRAKIVPIVPEALETIKKRLDKNVQFLPGHLLAKELQKITHHNKHSTHHSYC